jgi:hypothetical protein
MVMIDKERHGAINPEVTDQDGDDTQTRCDDRAAQQFAISGFGNCHAAGTSNWLMSLNVS